VVAQLTCEATSTCYAPPTRCMHLGMVCEEKGYVYMVCMGRMSPPRISTPPPQLTCTISMCTYHHSGGRGVMVYCVDGGTT